MNLQPSFFLVLFVYFLQKWDPCQYVLFHQFLLLIKIYWNKHQFWIIYIYTHFYQLVFFFIMFIKIRINFINPDRIFFNGIMFFKDLLYFWFSFKIWTFRNFRIWNHYFFSKSINCSYTSCFFSSTLSCRGEKHAPQQLS